MRKFLAGTAFALSLAASPALAQNSPSLTPAENAFAIDLYGQLATQPGNFVVSPYSIATAAAQKTFGAGLEHTNFANAQDAADKINNWVADHTA